jgi:hypothetical protein
MMPAVKVIWGVNGRTNATARGIGSGSDNTQLIIENASWIEERGMFRTTRKPIVTAARICAELAIEGYSGWYLPSLEELQRAAQNLTSETCRSFYDTQFNCWTSTEFSETEAWYFTNMRNSEPKPIPKESYREGVRAVRRF